MLVAAKPSSFVKRMFLQITETISKFNAMKNLISLLSGITD